MLSLYDELEDEFLLLGVQTPIVDETKFIFLINKLLGCKLNRIQDLDVTYSEETYCFSSFLYENTHNEDDYIYIIKNLSHELSFTPTNNSLFYETTLNKSRPLLHKFSQYQYFIKFPEGMDSSQINKITLNSIEFIYNIQPINNISRKEKKYFLL